MKENKIQYVRKKITVLFFALASNSPPNFFTSCIQRYWQSNIFLLSDATLTSVVTVVCRLAN
jgi:hypothetical protein